MEESTVGSNDAIVMAEGEVHADSRNMANDSVAVGIGRSGGRRWLSWGGS